MSVFETERLVVRPLRLDDFEDFFALCGDPEVVRYMADGEPLSRDSTRRWIEISLENYRRSGWGCFAVSKKPEDAMIWFARPPERPGIVELIYAFGPENWGRGYATEAAEAIIRFGFEECGIERIEATVDSPNVASKRVLSKIGMSCEREEKLDDGSTIEYFAIERNGRA